MLGLRQPFFLALLSLTLILAVRLPNSEAFLATFASEGVSRTLSNNDFANYWIASGLVMSGRADDLFGDHSTYFAHMQHAFGPDYPWHAWSYPPHYLLFIFPLHLIGYKAAFLLFQAFTLLIFLAAVRAFVGRLDARVLALCLPIIAVNIWSGQNGFLIGALMTAALFLRYERPVLAGVLLGCLTIKPQLGILFPLLLLFERRWIVIASAGVTTAVLVGFSALLFGIAAWTGYFEHTTPYQFRVATEFGGIFLSMMPSSFGMMRLLGINAQIALTAHLVAAAAGIVIFAVGCMALRRPDERAIALIFATFVITPYSLFYDLGAFSAAVAVLADRWGIIGNSQPRLTEPRVFLVLVLALLPLLMLPMGSLLFPLAPLLVMLALVGSTLATPSSWSSRSNASAMAPSPAAASD